MQFHADRIEKIALSTFLLGLAASWAGDRLSLPQLMGGGILLVALAPAAFGLRALVAGHIRIPIADKGRYEESYQGIGARASGLLLLLVAVALALYGLVKVAGLEGEAGGLIDRSPGLVVVAIGIGLALFGITQASRGTVSHSGQVRRICMIPERIGGAVMTLLGLALVTGGLLHTASPVLFARAKNLLARALLSLLG